MDDHSLTPSSEDRLDVFASVQYDPEVWELVQKKFRHFEDLHRELEGHQSHRRDLLKQLSEVNGVIAQLQEKLISLSGDEKVRQETAEEAVPEEVATEAIAHDEVTAEPAPVKSITEEVADHEPVVGLAPIDESEDTSFDQMDATPSLAHESVMTWPDIDTASEVDATKNTESPETPEPTTMDAATAEQPEVKNETALEPYQPVIEQPAEVPADSNVTFAQPLPEASDPQLPPTPAEATQASAPHEAEQQPVAAEVPAEVHELQQLFDQADGQRRQSDSALKLVQLYDGKAEVFFEAMCRSHKQNGLSDEEARQEAVKDVHTMIATAKSHAAKADAPAEPSDKSKKKHSPSNGMRRLFSH